MISGNILNALSKVFIGLSLVLFIAAWWCGNSISRLSEHKPPTKSDTPSAIDTIALRTKRKSENSAPTTDRSETMKKALALRVESSEERAQRMKSTLKLLSSAASRAAADRIRVRLKFHDVYLKLGLSRDEITKFEEKAAEHLNSINVFNIPFGMYPEEEQQRHFKTHMASLEKLVLSTLGESAIPAFRESVAQGDVKEVIDKVGLQVFHDSPLTDDQREVLISMCLDENQAPGGVRTDPSKIDWNRVIDQASKILTKSQLDAFVNVVKIRKLDDEYRRVTGLPYRRPIRGM